MRVKKVNRYYCEFCNKGGCAAGHMKRHEERCTLNPQRTCGMCDIAENGRKGITPSELFEILPLSIVDSRRAEYDALVATQNNLLGRTEGHLGCDYTCKPCNERSLAWMEAGENVSAFVLNAAGASSAVILENLRQSCKGCPACMLAVIRQARSPVELDFDYKKESAAWLAEAYEDRESVYY